MQENWRPVVDYEDLYEVSDQGRVRSFDRVTVFSDGRKRTFRGRMLTPGHSQGYPRVNLYAADKSVRPRVIHQLVTEAFIGPCPDGQEVRHYDGDKKNCTLGNLIYGTRSDNYFDKYRHGKDVRGARHGMSKLTEEMVISIRKMCADGRYTQTQIAKFFDIDPSHVSDLKNRYRWGHI
jgi:hypothetical protein